MDASTPGLKQPGRPCGALNIVVPLVAESLGGLGKAAIKLFAEIARSQASSRHPVGHILRRLIDMHQPVAVQKGNFRRLSVCIKKLGAYAVTNRECPTAPRSPLKANQVRDRRAGRIYKWN